MKIRTLSVVSAILFAGFICLPAGAGAAEVNKLTKEVMASHATARSANQDKNELQINNPDRKKELLIGLGDQFKAYILAAQSPFQEPNGKPVPGNFRAMFGLQIPIK
jgi:hypothetical protein